MYFDYFLIHIFFAGFINRLIQFIYDLVMCNWSKSLINQDKIHQPNLILEEKGKVTVPNVVPVNVG